MRETCQFLSVFTMVCSSWYLVIDVAAFAETSNPIVRVEIGLPSMLLMIGRLLHSDSWPFPSFLPPQLFSSRCIIVVFTFNGWLLKRTLSFKFAYLEVLARQTAWRELPETFFYQAGNLCPYSKARPVSPFLDLHFFIVESSIFIPWCSWRPREPKDSI